VAADSGTIAEFLVSVGYKIDESQQSRFRQGVGQAATASAALQKSVDAAAKALGQLGEQLKKTSDEPARKYEEAQRRLALRQTELVKITQDLGRVAVLSATAFAAGILQVAKNYEQLYYLAQRVGTTVEDISKLAAGFGQVGKSAADAQAAIASLGMAMKAQPPVMEWVRQLTGTTDPAKAFAPLMRYFRTLPTWIRDQLAQERLGWSAELVESFMPAGVVERLEAREKKIGELFDDLKKHGVDIGDVGKQSAEFSGALNAIGDDLNLIWTEVLATVLPALNPLLHRIDDLLQVLLRWNAAHPGAAIAEELGALAVGAYSAITALRVFSGVVSGRITGLGGLFRGFGALFRTSVIGALILGIYELATHWDDITKTMKETTPEQWAALGKDAATALVNAVRSLFTGEGPGAFKPIHDALVQLVPAFYEAGKDMAGQLIRGISESLPTSGFWGTVFSMIGKTFAAPAIAGLPGPAEATTRTQQREDERGVAPPRAVEAPPELRMPAPFGPPAPGYQQGGIVTINAHEGEMVLPEPISRGLQAMIRAMQGAGPALRDTSNRAGERLADWLTGMGGTIPRIIIDNVNDFVEQLMQAQGEQDGKGTGAGAAPGEPTSRTVAGPPATAAGRGEPFSTTEQGPPMTAAPPGAGLPAPGKPTSQDPRGMIPIIRAAATKYGIDPDVAVKVAGSEGLADFLGDRGRSGGAFQLFTGGGLGNEFQKETGLDPLDPKNEAATIDWAMKNLSRTGWEPYHGAARVGVGARQGIGTPREAFVPQVTPGFPGAAPGPGEVAKGAYGVPGAVMNYADVTKAIGQPGENLTTVTGPGGHKFTVNKAAAEAFQGFLGELAKTGYNIGDIQGYSKREKRGGQGWSEHAYGAAIDINPDANKQGGTSTDMPAGIQQLAAKWGLIWGGSWQGKTYDPMHFQWGGSKPWLTTQAQPPVAVTPAAARGESPTGGPGVTTTPETNMPPWARPAAASLISGLQRPLPDMPALRAPQMPDRLSAASAQLDRISDARLTNQTTNNGGDTVTNEGDRTATMNVTNNISVQGEGGMGAQDTGSRYSRAQTRIYGDLMRNFKTQMA
jgi:hypothetical protein